MYKFIKVLVYMKMKWMSKLVYHVNDDQFCDGSKLKLDSMNAAANFCVEEFGTIFISQRVFIAEHFVIYSISFKE